ncbi:endonuclease YncB(thermonuclease family) [Rhizobium sp. BK529]|uniref:thermonuclease family protein n=1 Tax=Rhizobium sp. BK529 TaxID=2586983 RepID=UPI001610C4D7|nr:thermonuclease family protein [Rhizobium sp. BK529]MBB3590962.1 endonuclease YncB(thermonuclease family) [Rhizobium sp. BK529]
MARLFSLIRDGTIALAFLVLVALIAAKLNDRPDIQHQGAFRAVDGDSLVLDGERMRLKGIDAPELTQTCERAGQEWPCGRLAQHTLQQLVSDDDTQCGGSERDRYDRLLVICRSRAGDINAHMVAGGMAVSYGGYRREEEQARVQKLGLWAGRFEMPRDVRDQARHENSGLQRLIGKWTGWE